jgi:methylglutaconyl-CoA hydratase
VNEAEAVRYEVAGRVATLTMDQPQNRNALTPALLNGLADGLAAAVADPAVRVIVLTNTGPAFCAGADLSGAGSAVVAPSGGGSAVVAPSGGGSAVVAPSGGGSAVVAPRAGLTDVLAAIQDSPKPVLARIGGHCMGGGVGLAAACDISLASDTARFGFTEVRVGVAPAIISVVCLPRLRRGDALELFLSGERFSAERAAAVGLITRAVPAAALDAEVAAMTDKLLTGGPAALAAAKRLVYTVPGMTRAEAFSWAGELSGALFASDEAAEGMAAFREKRPPSW